MTQFSQAIFDSGNNTIPLTYSLLQIYERHIKKIPIVEKELLL
jgi:hypothetical protein